MNYFRVQKVKIPSSEIQWLAAESTASVTVEENSTGNVK